MQSPWIEDIQKAKTPFAFIRRVSRPYIPYAIGALFFGAFANGLNAILPLIYQDIVEAISVAATSGSYKALWIAALAYVLLYTGQMVGWRAVGFFGGRWSVGMRATGRYALLNHLINHSHRYFEDRFAGSISGKIHQAADGARSVTQTVFWDLWPVVVGFAISMYIAFSTSVYIGAIFVVWLCIVVPMNLGFTRWRLPGNLEYQKLGTKVRGLMVDIIGNIRAVHEYARGRGEIDQVRDLLIKHRRVALADWDRSEIVIGTNSIIHALSMSATVAAAVYLASIGAIEPSAVVLVVAMVFSVGQSILFIGNQINSFTEYWGEIREGLEDILNEHEVPDREGAQPLSVEAGEVRFVKTTFAYHEGEEVLREFSLTVRPGEKVGLIGKSGAGKSTLVKLLLRHYDLTDGSILIDEQNIAGVTQDSLREAVAIVPQEPILFHRSIRENIGYGNPKATAEDIERAAGLAQAHDFIERLPQGYDTLVGERGVKLSGGQRQRVAIARALLKGAPILLLDEATSALDSESEVAIQKALRELMKGKTVIAIAHRLSTLREMDRLIVLERGSVIEDGSHDELMQKGGVYAELWAHQSGGYLKDD